MACTAPPAAPPIGQENVPKPATHSPAPLEYPERDGARVNPAQVRSDDPDWQIANREISADQATLDTRSSQLSPEQLSQYLLRRGKTTSKKIALTFDDGPHPASTEKLLDLLRTENVKATFFFIGFMVDKYPELAKAAADAGHEIGNHTYSHVTLTKIPEEQVLTELKAANDAMTRVIGRTPRYFRPPGGDFSPAMVGAAADLGLTTVLWTDDPGDYANPGDQTLLSREMKELSPGGIVLLHDGSTDTLETLTSFIAAARQAGYEFVTLDELRSSDRSKQSTASR